MVRRVARTKRPVRLAREGMDDIDQWLAMLRAALERNCDRLDGVLAEMKTNQDTQ